MRTALILLLLFGLALPVALADEAEQEEESSGEEAADSTVFTSGEIVVFGRRDPADRTSFATEVSEEQIRAMGASNVAEALQAVTDARIDRAPTSISANGKQESLASIRGFDPRDIAVLIDGVPVYEPYFHVIDLRMIPAGDIAKIKVIKGSSSVLYGPNALGGAVNIITKKGTSKPETRLEASYGDVDAVSGAAHTLGAFRGVEYFLAPSFSKSDGYLISREMERTRNEDGGLRENSDFRNVSVSGKIGYGRGVNRIALSANHNEFEGGVPFSMEAVDPGTLWRKRWKKTMAALHGELSPVEMLYVRARMFYTRFFNTITTYEDTSMSSISSGGEAVSTYDNNIAGAILTPGLDFGAAGSVTLQGIYKYDTIQIQENAGEQWREYGGETYSAAMEYGLGRRLFAVTAGAAAHFFRRTKTPGEDLGQDDTAYDFQAGFSLEPLQWMTFKAGFAKKSAFPDMKTLYSSQGNPDLEPETAYNADAGFALRPASFLRLEVNGFASSVRDLIGKKELGNTFVYENVDEALIAGVESGIGIFLFEEMISAEVSHTCMHTEDKRADRKLESLDFRPEHKLSARANLALDFGLSFSVQYFYTGQRKYEQKGVDREVASLHEYGLVNARLAQRVRWSEDRYAAEIFVQAGNLLDVYYEDSPEKASPGRNLTAGVTIDF